MVDTLTTSYDTNATYGNLIQKTVQGRNDTLVTYYRLLPECQRRLMAGGTAGRTYVTDTWRNDALDFDQPV